ncbi:unnamed protein product, partial [Effrenium voratum]
AVRCGHFYVVVPKIGSLFDRTTFPPFAAYAVEGWWLDNLLKAGKLTRETYLSLAARVTVGFQKRLADVRVAERYEKDCALELAVRADAAALQELKWPMRNFPEVEAFLDCHTGAPAFRRPILAIVGGTRKSMLANDVLQRLADRLGLHGYIEVTVEDSEAMDLADFDRRLHSGVLLDGVGDALFLKRNREAPTRAAEDRERSPVSDECLFLQLFLLRACCSCHLRPFCFQLGRPALRPLAFQP